MKIQNAYTQKMPLPPAVDRKSKFKTFATAALAASIFLHPGISSAADPHLAQVQKKSAKTENKREYAGLKMIGLELKALRGIMRNDGPGIRILLNTPNEETLAEAGKKIKGRYISFIDEAVKALGQEFPAQGEKDAKTVAAMVKKGMDFIGSSFAYAETHLLAQAFSEEVGKGAIDCDTSSLALADILNQFGINSKIVIMQSHAIVKAETAEGPLYIETTSGKKRDADGEAPILFYTKETFAAAYPAIFFEMPLSRAEILIHHTAAAMHIQREEYNMAIKHLTKMIELEPKLAYAYAGRAEIRGIMGQHDAAIRDYSHAIVLEPAHPYLYEKRAKAYETKGDWYSAVQDYELAIERSEAMMETIMDSATNETDNAISKELNPSQDGRFLAQIGVRTKHLESMRGRMKDIRSEEENQSMILNRKMDETIAKLTSQMNEAFKGFDEVLGLQKRQTE